MAAPLRYARDGRNLSMIKTQLFEVLDDRGQKQRWLLTELARRGYSVSESYLSQVKAGTKAPSERFMTLVAEVMGLPEADLFYEDDEAGAAIPRRRPRATLSPTRESPPEPINVAIVGVGNCASSL